MIRCHSFTGDIIDAPAELLDMEVCIINFVCQQNSRKHWQLLLNACENYSKSGQAGNLLACTS